MREQTMREYIIKKEDTTNCDRKKLSTRFVISFLILCMLSALFAPSTSADVVWEDFNDFYEQHKDECVEITGRFDVLAGVEFSLKTSPGSQTEREVRDSAKEFFKNYGFKIVGTFNHEDEIWGFVNELGHGTSYSGWIPMDNVAVIYTPEDFVRDYSDSFYRYTNDPERIIKHLMSKDVVFWRWPCSGKNEYSFSGYGGSYFESLLNSSMKNVENYQLNSMYKDELGREWIYFKSDVQKGWICLDYPESVDIPTTISNFQPWSGDPSNNDVITIKGISIPVLIIALVAFVVLSSVALVFLLYRPEKRKTRM